MKELKLTLILIISLFFVNPIFSQKEGNIWYFGRYAGLDFNSGSPIALYGSQMNIWEGCSSISDENGALLFYTNGLSVWNKNHALMQNGTGLYGNHSSTQGALIVKAPESESRYYLFTTDGDQDWGLYYSEIDMTLGGGLGAITSTKNQMMLGYTTEKLCAVLHANSQDIWIITLKQSTNSYYAYLVTSSGVATTPVISNLGPSVGNSETDCIGEMKASRDGSKIAVTNLQSTSFVCNFNNQTGELDTPQTISGNSSIGFAGCEFSASGNRLYTTLAVIPNSELMQFDLTAPNINNSSVLIATTGGSNTLSYGSLKRGPDDKIYVTVKDYAYLGIINDPELGGTASNFVQNGIHLAGAESRLGLPNHINSIYVSYQLSAAEEQLSLSIYPNPSSEFISIKSEGKKITDIKIKDLSGREVEKITTDSGIYIGDLPAGLYYLELLVDGLPYKESFVKM